MFTIEKGKVPQLNSKGQVISKNKAKFNNIPLEKLEEGDSILIPFDYLKQNHLTSLLSLYKKENIGKNFVVRKESTGTRIFRTK